MKHRIVLALVCLLPVLSMAQSVVVHEQVNFPEQIPAGGYSGITWLGEDRYAVVTDNAAHDGFFVFRIQIDSLGCIIDVSNEGFRGNDDKGHDNEGVAWCPRQSSEGTDTGRESHGKDFEVAEMAVQGCFGKIRSGSPYLQCPDPPLLDGEREHAARRRTSGYTAE